MPAVGQPSNVAREPYYGEAKEIEGMMQGAPLPGETTPEPAEPAVQPSEQVESVQPEPQPVEEPGIPQNPGNLSVMPADYPVLQRQAMSDRKAFYMALGGLPNASPMLKRLVAQGLGGLSQPLVPQSGAPPGQGRSDVMSGDEAEMGM